MKRKTLFIVIVCFFSLLSIYVAAQQSKKNTGQTQSKTSPQYITGKRTRPAPLSDAVRVGDMLYLAGQLGTDSNSELVSGGVKEETKQIMEKMRRLLEDNGSSMDHVVKCTVMLADINERAAMSEIYVTYFKPDRLPARSAFGTSGLALGARVEIECIAVLK